MKRKTADLAYIALFTALLAVCSWISVPASVPFTLQTFAIFAACGLLGGRRAFFSIAAFILLGAAGVPVFSGFRAGAGVLSGPTGGYVVGFLFMPAVYSLIVRAFGRRPLSLFCAMTAELILLYLFGTLWFVTVYSARNGAVSFIEALAVCVLPFIIPDLVKITAAVILTEKLKKYVRLYT